MKLIEEYGVITDADGQGGAWVEARREAGCGGCAASGECGTALLANTLKRRPRRIRVSNPAAWPAGTSVVIGLPADALLRGALLTYLLPAGGLLSGAAVGEVLAPGGDLAALAGAICGLLLAVAEGRRRLRRSTQVLTPQLLRRAG